MVYDHVKNYVCIKHNNYIEDKKWLNITKHNAEIGVCEIFISEIVFHV